MRIAIIAEVYLPKIDGVVIRTVNLLRELEKCGDEVLVCCPEADRPRDGVLPLLEFRSFPFPAYPEYRVGLPDARLVRQMSEFSPDIVHYINPFAFGFRCFNLLARSGLNLPSIFSFHTLYGEFVKRYGVMKPLSQLVWWLMRAHHNCADANLTVSTIMQDELLQRGFQRVRFWPPAVDAELFRPSRATAEMRQRLSTGNPDNPLLLTVSRLAPEKNVDFLEQVLRRVPEAQLAIVGDGPHRSALERRFRGLNVKFVGYLCGAELAAAYASSDAFIYASETETMGNVVLEAMAAGLPVVAPRAGGIPSILSDRKSGLLYSPGDADMAARLTQQVLYDKSLSQELRSAARSHAEAMTWGHAAQCVREHYQATIEEYRACSDLHLERRVGLAAPVLNSLVLAFRMSAMFGQTRAAKRQDIYQPMPARAGVTGAFRQPN